MNNPMIDPFNDPAPKWSTKTVVALAGYVIATLVAISAMQGDNSKKSTELASAIAVVANGLGKHQAEQVLIDAEQTRRLDRIEARQVQQDALLFDICSALSCRGKPSGGDRGQ